MGEAFALLRDKKVQKRRFRFRDLPHYLLMELWLLANFFRYLWYRLIVVRFDLK
jgi:hypothetical protein